MKIMAYQILNELVNKQPNQDIYIDNKRVLHSITSTLEEGYGWQIVINLAGDNGMESKAYHYADDIEIEIKSQKINIDTSTEHT